MLLGGLWHGASWTFVVWGGLHGSYLILERQLRKRFGGQAWLQTTVARIGLALGTYLLVLITWVFFRAPSFDCAWAVLLGMAGAGESSSLLSTRQILIPVALSGLLLFKHWKLRDSSLEALFARMPWWLQASALGAMLFSIIMFSGDNRAFIYFQF